MNTAVTGILCGDCYAEQHASPHKFINAPIGAAIAAIAVSVVISIEVNGVDYVQGGAGAVAVIAGGMGSMMALTAHPNRNMKAGMLGVGLTLFGALQVLRGLGPMFF
ncbi:MAG: hypothetical protein DRJ42_29565 [Deltaproteobacteria bacterium]|nr:MAG: hypothetical protein DRJ42_29565 [Deltaproteobacteria bacterium]